MDYRCPHCGRDQAKRKLGLPIIAKMETECPGCMQALTMNIHQLEFTATLLFSVGFVGAVLAGIVLERQELIGVGIVVGLAGGAASYFIEHVYLRNWSRYLLKGAGPE